MVKRATWWLQLAWLAAALGLVVVLVAELQGVLVPAQCGPDPFEICRTPVPHSTSWLGVAVLSLALVGLGMWAAKLLARMRDGGPA